jgi:hypothetical protein
MRACMVQEIFSARLQASMSAAPGACWKHQAVPGHYDSTIYVNITVERSLRLRWWKRLQNERLVDRIVMVAQSG